MKFSEHLTAHVTPEWHKQYITYEAMKVMLYDAVEQAPSTETSDSEAIVAFFARFDEYFFQYCDKELCKINTFFSEKIAEATRKFAALQSDLSVSEDLTKKANGLRRRLMVPTTLLRRRKEAESGGEAVVYKSVNDIKLALSEFYLSLILLQNYQSLNFIGFCKILKKHDKLIKTDRGSHWRQANVETAPFYTNKEVDQLIKEIELLFTQKLEAGNRQKAMKRLRVPPLGGQQSPWTTFRVGLFAGVFLVMMVVVTVALNFQVSASGFDWHPALCMYRGMFLVILCVFLLGINTYGWRSSGVNHVLIFELDPRNHLNHQQLLEVAGFFAVVWCISLLLYVFSDVLYIPAYSCPLSLAAFITIYLLNPFRVLHYRARRWLLRIMFRIFTAPFHYVNFADFWLADQLNSLTRVLLDLEFLICYYIMQVDWLGHDRPSVCGSVTYGVRPLVSCLPAWFRFAQCLRRYRDTRLAFPHIVNAGKYSTTFFVVLFKSLYLEYRSSHGDSDAQNSAFLYLWIIAEVVRTCYTLTWDIKMDWGLLDKNAGENRLLREEIVYPRKCYYYFAIAEDLVLRFAWMASITVQLYRFIDSEILVTVLASLEVFRRFVWNFFRLENEHLNNCGQFRAVRDISIAPINSNDQALLQQMMDDEDGVIHRRSMSAWTKYVTAVTSSQAHDDTRMLVKHVDDDDD